MMTVKVLGKLETSSLVALTDKSETPNVSVAQVLTDAGFAIWGKGTVTEPPGDTKEASGE